MGLVSNPVNVFFQVFCGPKLLELETRTKTATTNLP